MLIFDFDGVLIDSLDEVTVSGYNAVTGMLKTDLSELPAPLIRLFKKNRFHFQPAGDVIPLMQWCLEHYQAAPDKLLAPEEYESLIRKTPLPLLERTNRFYDRRKVFVARNARAWLALHRPYRPLWDALVEHGGGRLIILTNKNREAVYNLCGHFGLKVPETNIYGGDEGASKLNNLEKIHTRFGRNRYELLDDSLKNLRQLERSFNRGSRLLEPILAAWGYLGPTSRSDALAYGYRVCGQRDILALLPDRLP